MTCERLHDLVAQGEGPALEFKRSVTKDLGRELCAFANSGGGTLLVGVSDGGRIVGVAKHNRTKSRIQSIARSADPPIEVGIDAIDEILRVTVASRPHTAYSFGGRFFRRDGATSQQMSITEIENLFYSTGRLHFDKTPCPLFDIERDLDDAVWAAFSRRAKVPEAMDRIAALSNLGLVAAGDRMTHAGAWLTARDIRTYTTSAYVSCALFLGRTKSRILDRRDFHGDAASMIDGATAWILSKINVELVIKSVRREERPELPEEALREAVANAVAHRDYRSGGNVQVYVFKDRVKIVSPGGLPAGMTEAELGVKSLPRNPLLFGMLYRMDVVEQVGSGIRRIRDRCREHGALEPAIEVSEHWVTVTFPRTDPEGPECEPESGPESRPESGQASAEVRGGAGTRPESKPESAKARVTRPELADAGPESGSEEDSADDEDEALDRQVLTLLDGGPMSKSAIARALGHRSVSGGLNRVMRALRREGLVEYTLPGKPTSSRQEYRLTVLDDNSRPRAPQG